MNTTVLPFGNNILIEPVENKTALGQESLCQYGKVIAIGDEVKKVAIGDTIGFTVWGMNHLEINDTKYYIIPEQNDFILAKISL